MDRRRAMAMSIATLFGLMTTISTCVHAATHTFCSLAPAMYDQALQAHPELKTAIQQVQRQPIAVWYSDAIDAAAMQARVQELVATCPEESVLTVVVHGLPNKDCGRSSSEKANKNADDYVRFIQALAHIIGKRKIQYVLEPNAVDLIAHSKCGTDMTYGQHLMSSIQVLGANENAKLYLDVDYRSISSPNGAASVAGVVKDLAQVNQSVKGILLNRGDYRANVELVQLCANFQQAYGSDTMHCILDTSRNYKTKEASNDQWCNVKSAGLGYPPRSNTGYGNIDSFAWIKAPGESDGNCANESANALRGPPTGDFLPDHFKQLWSHGYLVEEVKMPNISSSPTKLDFDEEQTTELSDDVLDDAQMVTMNKENAPESAASGLEELAATEDDDMDFDDKVTDTDLPYEENDAVSDFSMIEAPSDAVDLHTGDWNAASMSAFSDDDESVLPSTTPPRSNAPSQALTPSPSEKRANVSSDDEVGMKITTKQSNTKGPHTGFVVSMVMLGVIGAVIAVAIVVRVRKQRAKDRELKTPFPDIAITPIGIATL